ncbi:MAG: hypothetical protein P4L67_02255 [Candidatus Pacebacteria bacterium]|nr:hypothetical protein [Candidatus Paceibacterota bacterium]
MGQLRKGDQEKSGKLESEYKAMMKENNTLVALKDQLTGENKELIKKLEEAKHARTEEQKEQEQARKDQLVFSYEKLSQDLDDLKKVSPHKIEVRRNYRRSQAPCRSPGSPSRVRSRLSSPTSASSPSRPRLAPSLLNLPESSRRP